MSEKELHTHGTDCACGHNHHHHDDGCGCGHDHAHEDIDKKAFLRKLVPGLFFFLLGAAVEHLIPGSESSTLWHYVELAAFALSYIFVGFSILREAVEGVLATLFMIVVGVGYLYWQGKKGHDDPEAAIELYQVQGGILDEKELEQRAPGFWISLLPMVVTFVLINGFGVELLYGLTAGCVLSLLFFCKSLGGVKGFGEIVSEGFNNGIFPCIIIAAVVGVGKVVSATDVFALVQENIINLPLPGLVKVAAITTIIAGITGSASGGLTIALELFGETFISWGYTPEIIHRVASIACGGLDTLPWNGCSPCPACPIRRATSTWRWRRSFCRCCP